jgi:hypothetical protein
LRSPATPFIVGESSDVDVSPWWRLCDQQIAASVCGKIVARRFRPTTGDGGKDVRPRRHTTVVIGNDNALDVNVTPDPEQIISSAGGKSG